MGGSEVGTIRVTTVEVSELKHTCKIYDRGGCEKS